MTVLDLDDLFAPEVNADPFTYFAHLREADPVYWNERFQLWVVTRYEDVVWLLRHHEFFSSAVIKTTTQPRMQLSRFAFISSITNALLPSSCPGTISRPTGFTSSPIFVPLWLL